MNAMTKPSVRLDADQKSTRAGKRESAASKLVETLIDSLGKHWPSGDFHDACLDGAAELYLRLISSSDVRFFEAFLQGDISFERALAAAYVYVMKSAQRRVNSPNPVKVVTLEFEPMVESGVTSSAIAREAFELLESELSETDAMILRQKVQCHTFREIGFLSQRSTSWAAWRWKQICEAANNLAWSLDWKESAANKYDQTLLQ